MKTITLSLFMLISFVCYSYAQLVKDPCYAGTSYPNDSDSLDLLITNYLNNQNHILRDSQIKVLIVPHYPPAWELTALGFKQISGYTPNTVVLICNFHGIPFDGVAIDNSDFWRTPFGEIPVNRELAKRLVSSSDKIIFNSSVFKEDWTIELLLPFLQKVLQNDFNILPILFGDDLKIGSELSNNFTIVSNLLTKNLNSNDLVIISNDMAHDFTGDFISEETDKRLLPIIEGGDVEELIEFQKDYNKNKKLHSNVISCGIDGIKAGLEYFNNIGGGEIKTLDYGNTDIDGYYVGFATILMCQSR
jgi:AmmeMemoRadiSam system protein B